MDTSQLNKSSIRATWHLYAGPGKAASFCVSHGVLRTSSPLPKGIKQGMAKECLKNAGRLALEHPDTLTYCEGWAQAPTPENFTTYHAWCLDRQGKVVDPTWAYREDSEYLGIPIKTAAFRQHIISTGQWGVFLHGMYLPKGFSTNHEAFIEGNFCDESRDGEVF